MSTACDEYDWCPNCDFCGDDGCKQCNYGTKPNHNHERWARMDEAAKRQQVRELAAMGITPW